MNDLTTRKLTTKDYLVVASMLFALFFGAGNLIFPLHLGQLAGGHWAAATAGFLLTGVVLPLLSVLAIAITKANGVYDVGLPLGKWFALTFMVLIHATIGPLFGTPRTATVSFATGISPLLPQNMQTVGLFVFSLLFFVAAFWLAAKPNNILKSLGKLLNPAFLVLLFAVFFVAFLHPMGNANTGAVSESYQNASFFNGFLEGYNTMDALAGLAFGVTVVSAVKALGQKRSNAVAAVTAKAGVLAMLLVAFIYVLLILVGAMSLGKFSLSEDGGVAFNQIVNHYAGAFGQAVLAVLLTLACLTTAVGLVAAFAQDFHHHFPKVSYKVWLFISCLASFIPANFGLTQLIAWSTPLLMFLYPLAMVLILLSVFSPLFNRHGVVYAFVVGLTVIPAMMDMVVSMPAVVSQSAFGMWVAGLRSHLPLASLGMAWLVFALVGAVLGVACYCLTNKTVNSTAQELEE